MKYAGILQPLLSAARSKLPGRPGRLVGQAVVLPGLPSRAYICFDFDGNLHFLLEPPAPKPERFEEYRLRFLEIENQSWSVADEGLRPFLDICCYTSRAPSLERPFLSFCEDILVDLEAFRQPDLAVLKTCRRWGRFWAEEGDDTFSLEWLRGLMGELSFLNRLILSNGLSAVKSWTGPEGSDHDFQRGTEIAFEVKTAAELPFVVSCNINQLDSTIFADLFLVCYLLTRSEDGLSLVDLVRSVEERVFEDDEVAELFFARLQQVGYRRHLESAYAAHRFKVAEPQFFCVEEGFPRITRSSFVPPLDGRIQEIRYKVEITGVNPIDPADNNLKQSIAKLGEPS